MNDELPIKNRVSESGLVQIDIKDFLPQPVEIIEADLRDYLHQGLVLIEKDFREKIKNLDLTPYQGAYVCIFCSADAVVPLWAYFLFTSKLTGAAKGIFYGTKCEALSQILLEEIKNADIEKYRDARVIIRGCTDLEISENVYVALVQRLQPVVSALMFGEACSSVPIFKKSRTAI